jgi:opacity protein-like surface antigen
MAGLSYSISQNVKLDFGYRYLDMGRVTSNPIICSGSGVCPNEVQSVKLASHDIRLGLRYMFDSNPGPAYEPLPPPPLVRKY